MAIFSLSDHKDKKEANSKLPSKEFIKKYKWWLVAGLAVGLVAFLYFKNKSGSSASSTGTSSGAGTAAVDPNTGIPYATELAQAQNNAAAGSGGSSVLPSSGSNGSSGGGSSTVTGTPSTSPATPSGTAPAATPATPTVSTPGNPPAHSTPTPHVKTPIRVNHPGKPVTTLPARVLPAIKRAGFPYPVAAKNTVSA